MPVDTKDIIQTPSGIISKAEHAELLKQYPAGIPASAVKQTITERTEPLPYVVKQQEAQRQQTLDSIRNLKRLTREQYDVFKSLSQREQFDLMVKLGDIPEGSQYVAGLKVDWSKSGLTKEEIRQREARMVKLTGRPIGGFGFYTPEQVAEMEKERVVIQQAAERQQVRIEERTARYRAEQAKINAALAKLKPYEQDGKYNLQQAFADGKGGDVYAARKLDIFTPEQIVDAQFGHIKVRQFESAHTQLPDGQWIDNKQLNKIQKESPTIHQALITDGFGEANKIIEKQEAALAKLSNYKVHQFSEALMYEAVKSGQYTVPEIVAKREKEISGYDVVGYLRDHPGETGVLIAAGYDKAMVDNVNQAVVATDKYWVDNKNLDVYTAYVAGVEPKHLETLTGQKEKDIKGLPPPLLTFLQSYKKINPPPVVKRGTPIYLRPDARLLKWERSAMKEYERLYGKGAAYKARLITVASSWFVPAKALEPRITIKDVTAIDWLIGVGQVALYTAPIWVPRFLHLVKPLSGVEKLAKVAGQARLKVNIAQSKMFNKPMTSPGYARLASNTQHAIQASMKADKAFLAKLASLNKISPAQLKSIEKLSGIKHLATSIKQVNIARVNVTKAWDSIDKTKFYTNPTTPQQVASNNAYLAKLHTLQVAQNDLSNSLARLSGTMTPVYQLSPVASWNNVINSTQKEIVSLKAEMVRAEAAMKKATLPSVKQETHGYWLGIKDQLTSAEARLRSYQIAAKAGKLPPDIARFVVGHQTPTQAARAQLDATLKQIDDWLKGVGKYKPTVPPGAKGPVVVAERTKQIAVPKVIPKIKLTPTYKKVPKTAVVETAPKIAPVKKSVFPGIVAPKIKVTTKTDTHIIPSEEFGRMTAAQIQKRYGEEIMVDAYSPHRIEAPKGKPAEWLSPEQAIKKAQQISVNSYVRQINEAAVRQAAQVRAQGATQAQMQSAVQQVVAQQTKAITNPATQAQVQAAIKPATIVTTALATIPAPVTPTPTGVPAPFPIILPNPGNKQAGDLTAAEKKGATAWAQGFGWWIVFVRGGKKYAFFHKGEKPPKGIRQVDPGKGEAYRSIQQFRGRPTRFKLPMGVVSVGVEDAAREPGKRGAIRFSPLRPRITEKRPRIKV
jgi:hypothetical protein